MRTTAKKKKEFKKTGNASECVIIGQMKKKKNHY